MRRYGMFAFGLILLSHATPAFAQSKGAEVRVVVGISLQGGVFGDDSPRPSRGVVGVTLGAQARWRADRGTGMVLDVSFQPVAVKNPHFDERLRVLSIQIAPEIGKSVYVRPGLGVALHFWSGDTDSLVSFGPSVGLAVGMHRDVGSGVRISPEFIAKASLTPGALSLTRAVQVPVSWGRR